MMEQNILFSQNQNKKTELAPSVSIDIVRNLEDLKAAFEIRKQSFILEKGFSQETEFDENDFACTHILMKVNEKPVGTLRIRCFKDFAKMERLCILKEYRGQKLYKHLLDYTEEYLKTKGYDCFVGYILNDLADYWFARGFKPNPQMQAVQKGNLTLLPVIYPFSVTKISSHQSPFDLLAKEGKIKTY